MLYYINKQFLAPELSSQDSAIVATIHKPREITKYCNVTVETTISDCHQNVNIAFNFRTEKEFASASAKLDVLIDNLVNLKKQMQKAEKEFRKELNKLPSDKLLDD